MNQKRRIYKDENSVSIVLETSVAVTVVIVILSLFFTSLNNLYTPYARHDVDLQAKIIDVCETLINSQGRTKYYTLDWDDDPKNVSILGLAASPLIEYGTCNINDGSKDPYSPPQGSLRGLARTCFLPGTKIILADGSYRNIEEVCVGDIVKSFNVKTGTVVNRNVTTVFHHSPGEMTDYYMVINNFLKVTPNHMLYTAGKWMTFDDVAVGDVVNNVRVSSIEKVYEKVPTFDLEIERDHSYFVSLSDDFILVHNEVNVDWEPWVLTSKKAYPTGGLEPYGSDYYIEYTGYGANPVDNKIYEIKAKTNYPYAVLDSQKISALQIQDITYTNATSMLGLDAVKYALYYLNITIRSETGTVDYTYGKSYDNANVVVSSARNVLIYYPPEFDGSLQPPRYEYGKITVCVFL